MDDRRYLTGSRTGGGGLNTYAAGKKQYGGGRISPNLGPTENKQGYLQRDREAAARRNYTLKQMQKTQGLKFQIL